MKGLLLINLGTPDEPTPRAVRRYLRQFLGDPRVLDISPVGRFLLLNLIILPRRPKRSAHAYRQIWDERGSPLLYHGEDLLAQVRKRLGDQWRVALSMRYGSPSIAAALEQLDGVDPLVVLPLFPQWADSSTGSAIAEARRAAGDRELLIIDDFFDDEGFLDAFVAVGAPLCADFEPDHVLFSFHGVPERHIRKFDESGAHCLATDDCCASVGEHNRFCYRAQCFATARQLARRLDIEAGAYTVSFQSRLGRTPWIRPYTSEVIEELAERGVKRLAVFCPAFVADCLETLEEIGIRARQQFLDAGGEELALVPSLNSTPAWADAVAALARRRLERFQS